jgi:sec-independent protein translocase protein TatC
MPNQDPASQTPSQKIANFVDNPYASLPPETQEAIQKYMPYLQEAQKKLLLVGFVFLAASILGGFFHRQILTFIMHRFDLTGVNVVLTSPYQVVDLMIQTGIYTGLLVTTPLFVYALLSFLKPALAPAEYKIITSLLPFSAILFVIGFFFGTWVLNFVIKTLIGISLGFVFQFPVIVTILIRLGIVKLHQFQQYRPYVYAGVVIFAAMLPPTDILSLTLLTVPLFVLFESSLLLNRSAKQRMVKV